MSHFFDYSRYYNLLYKDKDYAGEVNYIDSVIRKFHKSPSTLLDIGCGTGIHASLFADRGLNVHGVDLSNEMLQVAKKKESEKLSFSQGDATSFRLGKKFDVITSLFHVMSYQTSNQAVEASFATAAGHLKPGGIFIFDCWYGPAVLIDPPVVRVKRMEDDKLSILRISEPVMDFRKSIVEVNFEVHATDRQSQQTQVVREKHPMRYFFENELHLFAETAGFRIQDIYAWMETTAPKPTSWYITIICSGK